MLIFFGWQRIYRQYWSKDEGKGQLVTTGIYRYIRHPLYASLLALVWGTALKRPAAAALLLGLGATILLTVTAKLDEAECRRYFGEDYVRYMAHSRMFVPFLF
jgi:protein-S-isoprenylcysteine O-methyltransferase Ste14